MMLRRTPMLLGLIAITLATGLACKKNLKLSQEAKRKKEMEGRSATELVDQAHILLQRKKWMEGRRLLRVVEENLPSSKEYPRAKLMLGDSFFFAGSPSYPEAQVEYTNFLTYFPNHELRAYALYRVALCHYASIMTADRDQAETRKALEGFQKLLDEAPGSPYAVDAKAKINQCWRRLAEAELSVGIFYVKTYPTSSAGEKRIKDALQTYPDFIDRERAYYFLGEVMRRRLLDPLQMEQYGRDYLSRVGKDDFNAFTRADWKQFFTERDAFMVEEITKYRAEAKSYYQKLVESYPASILAGRAKDRLIEMGQANVQEELDS